MKNIESNKGKITNNIQGNSHQVPTDFSTETLQARREQHDIFKLIKRRSLQPKMRYPTRLSFHFDREIKSFKTGKSSENSALPNQLYNKC